MVLAVGLDLDAEANILKIIKITGKIILMLEKKEEEVKGEIKGEENTKDKERLK